VYVADFDSSTILEAGERPTVLFKGECKLKQLALKGEFLPLIINIEFPERRRREIYIPTRGHPQLYLKK